MHGGEWCLQSYGGKRLKSVETYTYINPIHNQELGRNEDKFSYKRWTLSKIQFARKSGLRRAPRYVEEQTKARAQCTTILMQMPGWPFLYEYLSFSGPQLSRLQKRGRWIRQYLQPFRALPQWLGGKESACNAGDVGDVGSILGQEDPLEEGMATHSGVLAWRIPWTEEPGRLRSVGVAKSWTQLK